MSSERLPGPRGLSHLRLLRRLFNDPATVLDEIRHFGPVCGLGGGPVRVSIVGDPKVLGELFSMPSDTFRWNHRFNVLGFVVGPGSMIVSDGIEHRRRRGSVQAAFSRKRLNGWIPMMVDRADAAIDAVVSTIGTRTQTVDLFPYGRQAVLGIAVHAFFGERLASRAEEIGALFSRPQKYLESSAIRQLPHPLPFTRRAHVRDDRRALDAIIDAEIDHRRRQPAGDPLDVLEVLAHDNTLTDAEIRDQVVTLIGAGYDTTSASFSWTLWRAAQPEVWARLRAEADEVLGPPDAPNGTPDTDTLARLVFANRVMREALRLHPAGTLSPREATVDVELGGHTIRKGTLILWSAYLAGRDPDAWSDPLRFDPDRFADLSPEQKAIADQAWVPFGRGARNCIGFMLAQMELTLMIARFAQRLDVSLTSDTVPRPVGMVVNRPTGGAPMRVSARVS